MTPNDTLRYLVPWSAILREASSCSKWKQIEAHSQTLGRKLETLEHSALNKTKSI